ncbi:hypothetical protein N7504_005483 [Penicillium tannophilum]|nr:hypothetical protein N7504_005483 [Penicillium tannophilum]
MVLGKATCPSNVADCPASEKSSYVTTETIVVSTTVCPVTETTHAISTGLNYSGSNGIGESKLSPEQSITSTILSTRTATITACPSSVTNCPASEESTYVTTETIIVSTTVCPVTETAHATSTGSNYSGSNGAGESQPLSEQLTTSTILSTRTATITACPSSVTSCPASEKSTYVTTETVVVSTTVCPVTALGTIPSSVPVGEASGGADQAFTTSISTEAAGNSAYGSTSEFSGAEGQASTTLIGAEATGIPAYVSTSEVSGAAGQLSTTLIGAEAIENITYASTSSTDHGDHTTFTFNMLNASSTASSKALTSSLPLPKTEVSTSSRQKATKTATDSAISAVYTGSASPTWKLQSCRHFVLLAAVSVVLSVFY